jgi:hypothetical protein
LVCAVDTAGEVASLSDEDVEDLLVQARRLQSQAEGPQVALVAEGERHSVAAARSLASGAGCVRWSRADLAAEHEARMLDKKSRHAETWFSLQDRGHGTYQGRFVIPELHGILLKTFLERLSAPAHDPDWQPAQDTHATWRFKRTGYAALIA